VKRPFLFIIAVGVLAALSSGCGQPAEPPVQQRAVTADPATTARPRPAEPVAAVPAAAVPAAAEPTATQEAPVERAGTTPPPRRVEKRAPKRPEDSWVIFREARDEAADATCDAQWLGGNRFRVKTQNIKRMTFDMTRLPEGAPAKGPWIIHVDGRSIELTGFKPKRGYTGHKRDLVCSKNGVWTVDRRKLYRTGG
jgi:hypothetical protein